jgi:hypothetical protein
MSPKWHTFKVKRTLVPSQKGTKKFVRRYGDRLVCVRYRDDAELQRKITTVEIVADERPWHPVPKRIPDDTWLSLNVEYGEVAIGKAVRAAGGRWYPRQKVWKLTYKAIVALGLTDRIVPDSYGEDAG